MSWQEFPHPVWGIGGVEESVHEIVRSVTFPKTIWRNGNHSIIPPCGITFEQWEAYDGSEIERFGTLDEAKTWLSIRA